MAVQPDFDLKPLTVAERERLAATLTEVERRILLFQGTEPPFCGGLLKEGGPGAYVCRLCALPLFKAETKFDSGTGWPSFYEAYHESHVRKLEDRSQGHLRVEIRCARCDGHLGHVFPDGPPPTGQRFCLNSLSLEFVATGAQWPDKLQR